MHANHPRGLTGAARALRGRLVDAGIVMLNQSGAAAGGSTTMSRCLRCSAASSRRGCGRTIYIIRTLPARAFPGVSLAEGQALVKALRGRVSGLCQPTYVLELFRRLRQGSDRCGERARRGRGVHIVGLARRGARVPAGGGIGNFTERAANSVIPAKAGTQVSACARG